MEAAVGDPQPLLRDPLWVATHRLGTTGLLYRRMNGVIIAL